MAKKSWIDQVKDSDVMQVVKILDPTGVTSYKDVYNAWTDGKFDYKDVTETLGALPLIGKVGKVIKYGVKGAELAAKMNRGAKVLNKARAIAQKVPVKQIVQHVPGRQVAKKVINSNALTRGAKNLTKSAANSVGRGVKGTVKSVIQDPVGVAASILNPREQMKFVANAVTLGGAGAVARGAGRLAGRMTPRVVKNIGTGVAKAQGKVLGTLASGMATPASIMGHGINLSIASARAGKVDPDFLIDSAGQVYGAGLATAAQYSPSLDNYLKQEAQRINADNIDYQMQNRYDIYDNYMATRTKNTMKRGGNEDVMNLQRELNAELHARGAKSGYLREDGLMGPKTQAILDKLERLNQQEEATGQLLNYE